MKKFTTVIVLCLGLLFAFTACGSDSSSNVNVETGSLIDIGTYNGEPIEWVVIDSPSDSSYCNLLSTRVLYNSTYRFEDDGSFLESDLIKNLNSEFSSDVFSEEEMSALGHWYYDGEESENFLAIPYAGDFEALLVEDADRMAIDVNGKKARWWLNDKRWVDENGVIQEDTDYYLKSNRTAGVRPIINASKEYVAANLKDGTYSSENYKPTYVAYDKENKKFTATVSQLHEDIAKNQFDVATGGGYIGVDPGNDYAATLDADYARYSAVNLPGTIKFSVDYVKDEATLIPVSDMDTAVPDIIWVNATMSSVESNIVAISLKDIGAVFAALDPDLSTEDAYNALANDIQNNSERFTSEINGIPYYFSYDNGNIYVEVNTTK
ncbi:MAG: hypothetical protein J6D57_08525 [Mogibacterium sp.]|nr:hypothetical protein [Mogibacterium sp.]